MVYRIRNRIISVFSLSLCSDTLYPGSPGSEVSFARQHNTSDNNNQCFLGSNGNSLLQLNPQKPGAIDNQPLVTQEPVKVKHILVLFHHSFFMLAFFQLNSELMLFCHTAKFRFLTLLLRRENCVLLLQLLLCFVRKGNIQNILTIGKVFMKRHLTALKIKYFDNQTLEHFHLNMNLLLLYNNIIKQNG